MTSGAQVVVSVLLGFVLCWVGKLAYGLFHPRTRLDVEVAAKDNLAFAVPLGAYYLGILIVMGAPLSGQARGGVVQDSLSVVGWGVLAVAFLNLGSLVKRKILFRELDLYGEILEQKNVAAGILAGGFHIANALLILGALGDEGGLLPAAVFWLYAQVLLALAAAVFLRLTHENLTAEIRRGNQAVALSLAGVLVAMGNVLRLAVSGPFEGWGAGLASATGYALAGLAILFAARWLFDWLLLPGVTIRHEILEQEVPNTGVGYLEALIYLGTSFLIAWAL